MATPNVKTSSALHDILAWSIARPDWLRDALRRIVVNGVIEDTDLMDLERLCLARHGADFSQEPSVVFSPLTEEHLPPAPGTAESVSLVSIGGLKHVNRLPSDQIIPFGSAPGITAVYGDNGSGKSGYARVIKKACRARGMPPIIRPNAFAPLSAEKASAAIVFQVGGANVSVTWIDGASADPRLANVFVFDSSSAGHYVNEDSPAVFTPYGLDVLPALSKTCDAMSERIQQEIRKINSAISTVATNWKYDATTKVGKVISNLSATSKEEEINALCGLNSIQEKRLQDLREALKSDPLQKAKETRATVARLDAFVKKATSIAIELAVEKVESLRKLVDEVMASEAAAKAFASGQFDASYLGGTGSALWLAMWEAGREYSLSGPYKDKPFPFISDTARCVFCQQELDEEAGKRLKAFEAFCADKSQQTAASAAKKLADAIGNLALVMSIYPEWEQLEADIAGMTPEQRALGAAFATKADERLHTVRDNLANRVWNTPAELPASPVAAITDFCLALEARAKTEESAHDPVIRQTLEAERSELQAREWLSGVKADVLAQIDSHKAIAKLERCKKDTTTTFITAKSTELTEKYVTEAFRLKFRDELKALGLRTLDVTLEPIQGKKGETKFGLRLTSAIGHKVVDIASEGEIRCIALAAFLAELSQASHNSALVFDDPVSSLDHWHREKIAARLVEESKTRQVIVFTHDVIFLNDLLAFADNYSMAPHVLSLEWCNGLPGKFMHGLPWDSKPPLDCLKELEQDQITISNTWNPQPNAKDAEVMRHAYSRLRSTMERIVEKEILDGVVSRFESQIITGRIRNLVGIPQSECDEARRLTQRCHDITDAHAPSKAAIPTPTELAQDLASAKALVGAIRQRKKAAQAATATK